MSNSITMAIKQLANRLEDATSIERMDALQELQGLARTESLLVGLHSLQKVLDLLKERGGAEEYQESLDLIYRLVTTRDHVASMDNTVIILAKTTNIELLLDLLEHEDITVGVMASQILTEVHARNGMLLEARIHDCPAGMNKLLQRLPDSSREEVRNQAIVLIQQLTISNEEMKKTVVFNEGFEIIFRIITSEGGSADAGLVIQDCLRICNNVLDSSETCQRLFYGMGIEWTIKLSDFFDPYTLESLSTTSGLDDSGIDIDTGCWFHIPGRLECAKLALEALNKSVLLTNQNHQSIVGMSVSSIVTSAAFWICRKGPAEIIDIALQLIARVVKDNKIVASEVFKNVIKVISCKQGKTIPIDAKVPSLHFGWKPLPSDDVKVISLSAVLAERYIYSSTAWAASSEGNYYNKSMLSVDGLSQGCMTLLENIVIANPSISDMIIQHILAPPPPPIQDDTVSLEPDRPLGLILVNLIVEGCTKLLESKDMPNVRQSLRTDIELVERSSNVLSLCLMHGELMAKELFTAITVGHTNLSSINRSQPIATTQSQPLMPYLLSIAGCLLRSQIQDSHIVIVSLLRMLTLAVSGCERASYQLFFDPANLYILDVATSISEASGVHLSVQVMSCLFLGSTFLALPFIDSTSINAASSHELNRKSLLSMIENRIGLTRFTDILKRPLLSRNDPTMQIFFSDSFRNFYDREVELVRNGIFQSYAGSIAHVDGDQCSSLNQIISMQKDTIAELESRIALLSNINGIKSCSNDNIVVIDHEASVVCTNCYELKSSVSSLNDTIADRDRSIAALVQHQGSLVHDLERLQIERETEVESVRRQMNDSNKNNNNVTSDDSDSNSEILSLKESILLLNGEKRQLMEQLDLRDRKIALILEDSRESLSSEASAGRLAELEVRNAELKQQLWSIEADCSRKTQCMIEAIKYLGVTVSMDFASTIRVINPGCTEDEKNVVSFLNECAESIVSAANSCSDMTEGIGLCELSGDEGTLIRITSCCDNLCNELSNKLIEISNITSAYNDAHHNEMKSKSDWEADRLALTTSISELHERLTQVSELQLEVDSLKRCNAALEAEVASSNGTRDGLMVEVNALKENVTIISDKCSAQIDDSIATTDSHRLEVLRLCDDINTLTSELSSKDASVSLLEDEVFKLHKELRCLREENADSRRAIEELKSAMKMRTEELSDMHVILQQYRSKEDDILYTPTSSKLRKSNPAATSDYDVRDSHEQMSDLLSLLAQQEVELSEFKRALGNLGGLEALVAAEKNARNYAVEKYGTYTDFRQEQLDDSIEDLW